MATAKRAYGPKRRAATKKKRATLNWDDALRLLRGNARNSPKKKAAKKASNKKTLTRKSSKRRNVASKAGAKRPAVKKAGVKRRSHPKKASAKKASAKKATAKKLTAKKRSAVKRPAVKKRTARQQRAAQNKKTKAAVARREKLREQNRKKSLTNKRRRENARKLREEKARIEKRRLDAERKRLERAGIRPTYGNLQIDLVRRFNDLLGEAIRTNQVPKVNVRDTVMHSDKSFGRKKVFRLNLVLAQGDAVDIVHTIRTWLAKRWPTNMYPLWLAKIVFATMGETLLGYGQAILKSDKPGADMFQVQGIESTGIWPTRAPMLERLEDELETLTAEQNAVVFLYYVEVMNYDYKGA